MPARQATIGTYLTLSRLSMEWHFSGTRPDLCLGEKETKPGQKPNRTAGTASPVSVLSQGVEARPLSR